MKASFKRKWSITYFCLANSYLSSYTLGLKVFGMGSRGGLFIKSNSFVSQGRNGEGRVATPTNTSIFDSYDMKTEELVI